MQTRAPLHGTSAAELSPDGPSADEELAVLSYPQEWMWVLDQLHPSSAVNNVYIAVAISGDLDLDALRRGLDAIVMRHQSLRTTFTLVPDGPRQRVRRSLGWEMLRSEVSLDERDAAVAAEIRRPFDLTLGPLFRFRVLTISPSEHVLVMTFHHAIMDRRSVRLLLSELEEGYRAFSTGSRPGLGRLPIAYTDFAAWQREQVHRERFDPLLSHWKSELSGELPALALPLDKPRPAEQGLIAGRSTAAIDPRLARRIRDVGAGEQASVLVFTLAAFAVLLCRYTGQTDVLIGTPFSGRIRPEIEPLVGCFINTLPIRVRIEGSPTFRSVLRQVRDSVRHAAEHQELPLATLVGALGISRTASVPPLFQALFARENSDDHVVRLHNLSTQTLDVTAPAIHMDLLWAITGAGNSLAIDARYDAALFDADTVERMVQSYLRLLDRFARDPECDVTTAPVLSAAETERMLVEWNATSVPYDSSRCLHQRFEAVVEANPEAVAVTVGEESWTYRELNARANRVAHRLRSLGVARGAYVAIAVERSLDMVVGVLGILKAGGAYVPLDTTYPDERVRYMLNDSGVPVILTQSHLRTRLTATAAKVLLLDAEEDQFEPQNSSNIANVSDADQAAYLIYTSGSTGVPKGVVVPHRAVVRLVVGAEYVPFGPTLTIAQVSNFSFDAVTFELWGSLLHGSRLVIVPKSVLLEPRRFASLLENESIGAMFLTAAFFNQIAHLSANAFRTVRYLMVGGEALDRQTVRTVMEAQRPYKLINGYGPTETTTFACTYDVDELEAEATSVPIGRPIANTRCYVLDRNRQLVPIGVTGELYIGGPGVALGYLNAAASTAEKFVPDPFSSEPPGVLYRTGDVVRYRRDGAIEFLGRLDHQVKIRGFRIELGEIEAAVRAHPAVRDALVLVRGDEDKRIVAYVTPQEGAVVDAAALRRFLATTLPDYMLPSDAVVVERFPLTANGKVDRHALPAPRLESIRSALAPAAAQTPVEVQLTALWEQLLGTTPIARDQNFFEIGGNSLLAIRMMAGIRELSGISVRTAILFERPTIALLAEAITSGEPSVRRSRYVAVRREGTALPFFLFHGYFNGGLYAINLSRHLGSDLPFYALHPHASDGSDEPVPATIHAMAVDHLRIIRTLQPRGPYALAGFCNGAYVAFEVACMLRREGEQIDLLAILSTRPPMRSPHLRRAIAALGRLKGLTFEAEVRSYLSWRAYAELASSPRLVLDRVWHRLASRARFAAPPHDGGTPTVPDETRLDARGIAYADAISRYVPSRFDGPLTLVQGREDYDPRSDPARGWRPLAQRVDFHLVPGSGNSSLTHQPDAVAAVLRAALERARAG